MEVKERQYTESYRADIRIYLNADHIYGLHYQMKWLFHRQFRYQISLQILKILLNIYLHLYVLKMGLISE